MMPMALLVGSFASSSSRPNVGFARGHSGIFGRRRGLGRRARLQPRRLSAAKALRERSKLQRMRTYGTNPSAKWQHRAEKTEASPGRAVYGNSLSDFRGNDERFRTRRHTRRNYRRQDSRYAIQGASESNESLSRADYRRHWKLTAYYRAQGERSGFPLADRSRSRLSPRSHRRPCDRSRSAIGRKRCAGLQRQMYISETRGHWECWTPSLGPHTSNNRSRRSHTVA